MPKSLVITEEASLATLMDRDKAIEFFFQSNDFALGDIYSARVENILTSIDAVFVNLGSDKMGFLHASDIPGAGPLTERVWPKQKLLVQIVKEPTSNKGPRVSNDITLIGRFFVLTTEHNNIVMSRRIVSSQERARLRSIATLLKPPVGFGLIIRTEAMSATEAELEEDFRELFLERWKYIIDQFEIQRRPNLIFSDSRDLLYRVLRDVFHDGVDQVAVDSPKAAERAKHYLELWSHKPPEVVVLPTRQLLKESGVLKELKDALSNRIELPNGGYVHIQATEAMTVVDVNSGKFTSSRSPGETVLKTNLEAATEVARQLRLRNIGGVIVIDFIDMDNKFDRLKLLEHFERLLENDPARPQIGRLSDLGLVELTRHRQEKSLLEALGHQCDKCHGLGSVFHIFDFANEEESSQVAVKHNEELNEINEFNDDLDNVDETSDLEQRDDFTKGNVNTSQDNLLDRNRQTRPIRLQGGHFNNDTRRNIPAPRSHPSAEPHSRRERYQQNNPRHNSRANGENMPYERPAHPSARNQGNQRQALRQQRPPRGNRFGQQGGGNQRYQQDPNYPNRRPPAIRPNQESNSNFVSSSQLEDALMSPTIQAPQNTEVIQRPSVENSPLPIFHNEPSTSTNNDFPPEQNTQGAVSKPEGQVDNNLQEKPQQNREIPQRRKPQEQAQSEEQNLPPVKRPAVVFPTLSLGENTTKEVLPGIFSFSDKDGE